MNTNRKKSQRGNALIEFALGWSVMWALFAGVYQYGYSIWAYNTLLTSVANAAELGSKLDYDTASPNTFTTSVTNMVLYGDITAGSKTLVPGLTATNVNVSVNPEGGMPTDITITITNFTVNGVFGSIRFDGKPRATAVYSGHITCSTC